MLLTIITYFYIDRDHQGAVDEQLTVNAIVVDSNPILGVSNNLIL